MSKLDGHLARPPWQLQQPHPSVSVSQTVPSKQTSTSA